MFSDLWKKLFPTPADKTVRAYGDSAARIEALMEQASELANEQLPQEARAAARGEARNIVRRETALALAGVAAVRGLGQKPFRVQLLAALAMLDGRVAEMATGEGKTLAAMLAAVVEALQGNAVYIATANDYLARRDAAQMRPAFEMLGLSVGLTLPGMPVQDKISAYRCDVTYGPCTEFVFDYLRDNLASRREERCQVSAPGLVIVDEADFVLLDSARWPLSITGSADPATVRAVPLLRDLPSLLTRQDDPQSAGDYWLDIARQTVVLSEQGHERLEKVLAEKGLLAEGESLYSARNSGLLVSALASLRADGLFHKGKHYVVQGDEVVLINELTGRLMPGARLEEGVHAALEAKEGVSVRPANVMLATISMQNYFSRSAKLAGMTGTAATEAEEFQQVYGLSVAVIPPRKPCVRVDHEDLIFMTAREKWDALVADIAARHETGQPVLIGTGSIADNEQVSRRLTAAGLPHVVLDATDPGAEAAVIAQAGRPGAITVAASLAGRGTDILLGGNPAPEREAALAELGTDEAQLPRLNAALTEISIRRAARHDEAVAAGGLYVVGTERGESRRMDNQLRGRAGRQGDPGESRFYLSLEDGLLEAFPDKAIRGLAESLRLPEGAALTHRWASKAVEAAQRQMEARNFNARKLMLWIDNTISAQREAVYEMRREVLEREADALALLSRLRSEAVADLVSLRLGEGERGWDAVGAEEALASELDLQVDLSAILDANPGITRTALIERARAASDETMAEKERTFGSEALGKAAQAILLWAFDRHWQAHLSALENLQHGIHLRGYANKDPKREFEREAFELFKGLLSAISKSAARAAHSLRAA